MEGGFGADPEKWVLPTLPAVCGAEKDSELTCRWPGMGPGRMWVAWGSPALYGAGGVGATASCGAGPSSHRGGVDPPCGTRGPPAGGPSAEGPHLLGGKAPGVSCQGAVRGTGWSQGPPLNRWTLSLSQGLSPGLRRDAWKFLLGYLSWEGSAEEHKAHVRKKT